MARTPLRHAAILAVVAFLGGCGIFPPPPDVLLNPDAGPTTLTSILSGIPIVSGKLNGISARFLIDTGSPYGVIGTAKVDHFGLAVGLPDPFSAPGAASDACAGSPGSQPFLYTGNRLQLGAFEFDRPTFMVVDRLPPEVEELGVDAVVGASMMSQLDWEVRDGGLTIVLSGPEALDRPGGASDLISANIQAYGAARLSVLSVPGGFDEQQVVPLLIDTGYSGVLGSTEFVAGQASVNDPAQPHGMLAVSSWSTVCAGDTYINPRSFVGEEEFDDVPVDILPIASDPLTGAYGLVGWGLLAAHHTRVSPSGGWIHLEATAGTEARLANTADFGFTLARREDGFFDVRYVIPGSPAEDAGMEMGDVVEKVNGQSVVGVPQFDLMPFSPNDGDKLSLGIRHGDGTYQDASVTAEPRV